MGRLVLGLAVLLALWAAGAGARPEYVTQFRRVYRPDRRSELYKASCMLCHESKRGGGKLNPYGEDLRKASRRLTREYKSKKPPKWDPERGGLGLYQYAAYRAVEKLDSDGDKGENWLEIKQDKLPGQNWSVPKLPKKPKAEATEKGEEKPPEGGADKPAGTQ